MMHYMALETAFGPFWIAEDGSALTHLGFGQPLPLSDTTLEETPLLSQAKLQLLQYLSGERKEFDLPLNPRGTAFNLGVWRALRDIPYGETRTYVEIAESIGRPKSSRAVAMANNKNPLLIITPCHRMTGSNGETVDFGVWLEIKQMLLNLERQHR